MFENISYDLYIIMSPSSPRKVAHKCLVLLGSRLYLCLLDAYALKRKRIVLTGGLT